MWFFVLFVNTGDSWRLPGWHCLKFWNHELRASKFFCSRCCSNLCLLWERRQSFQLIDLSPFCWTKEFNFCSCSYCEFQHVMSLISPRWIRSPWQVQKLFAAVLAMHLNCTIRRWSIRSLFILRLVIAYVNSPVIISNMRKHCFSSSYPAVKSVGVVFLFKISHKANCLIN